MPQRFDAGPLLAVAGALVLLISLFVEWFSPGLTGWRAFEAIDVLLAAAALGALVVALGRLREGGVAAGRLLLALGALALLAVLVQLLDPPPLVDERAGIAAGAWLALAGAGLLAVGGLLTAARLSVTVDVAPRDARRRVAAVDRRRPAPVADRPAGEERGGEHEAPGELDDAPRTVPFETFQPVTRERRDPRG